MRTTRRGWAVKSAKSTSILDDGAQTTGLRLRSDERLHRFRNKQDVAVGRTENPEPRQGALDLRCASERNWSRR